MMSLSFHKHQFEQDQILNLGRRCDRVGNFCRNSLDEARCLVSAGLLCQIVLPRLIEGGIAGFGLVQDSANTSDGNGTHRRDEL